MTTTFLSYTVGDTAQSEVDPTRFNLEIRNDATIAVSALTYLGCMTDGAVDDPLTPLTVHFIASDNPSQAEKDAVTAVVNAHKAAPDNVIERTVGDAQTDVVSALDLRDEILADATIAASALTLKGVHVDGPNDAPATRLIIVFADGDVPSAGEIAAIDAVLAAHAGVFAPSPKYLAGRLVALETAVLVSGSWNRLGVPVPLSPVFWSTDLAPLLGQLALIAVVQKGAADELPQFRIVELLNDGTTPVVLGTGAIADTAGAEQAFEILTTSPPRAGLNQYSVEVDLNNAVSCVVKSASLNLFKV